MRVNGETMKHVVAILKLAQIAGGTGLIMMPFFLDPVHERLAISSNKLLLAFALMAVASSLGLAAFGERTRAWKGALIIVLAVVFTALASAPMVIR